LACYARYDTNTDAPPLLSVDKEDASPQTPLLLDIIIMYHLSSARSCHQACARDPTLACLGTPLPDKDSSQSVQVP